MRPVMFVAAAALAVLACKSRSSAKPAPVDEVFPTFDATCVTDEDCATTNFTSACCRVCQPTYGSRSWAARVEAFCEAHPGAVCEPQSCSTMVAAQKCIRGECYPGR